MEILKLNEKDFDNEGRYIGKTDVSDFQGNIEIAEGLGWVFFEKIKVAGYLLAKAGTSIEAGKYIKSGWYIEAGGYIKSGWYIEAGENIKAGEYIEAGKSIKANGSIKADESIEAGKYIKSGWYIEAGGYIKSDWYIETGGYIKSGWYIKAGEDIKAGEYIEAGEGIVSGLAISCKKVLQFSTYLFCGICWWRKLQNDKEKTITCGKLQGGEVCYGIVKELGLPDDESKEIDLSGKEIEIKLNNKIYKAIIQEITNTKNENNC